MLLLLLRISSLPIKRSPLSRPAKFASIPLGCPFCIIPLPQISGTLCSFYTLCPIKTQAQEESYQYYASFIPWYDIQITKSPNRDPRAMGFKSCGSFGIKDNLIPDKGISGHSFVICELFQVLLKFYHILLKDKLKYIKFKSLFEQKIDSNQAVSNLAYGKVL